MNLFFETRVTLMSKLEKDITKRKTTNTVIGIEVLNEILANLAQQHRKRVIIMIEWGLFQECNVSLIFQYKWMQFKE